MGEKCDATAKQISNSRTATDALASSDISRIRKEADSYMEGFRTESGKSLDEATNQNENTRASTNLSFEDELTQIKAIHSVLATLNIGMAEHNQLMIILDKMEANLVTSAKDANFNHNSIADANEETNHRLCQHVQQMHDVMIEFAQKLHDDLYEKYTGMSLIANKGNDALHSETSMALRSELGLLRMTVDQNATRAARLDQIVADLRQNLRATTADLSASKGECRVLHESEDTLKYQLKRFSNQINAQAEREVDMALTIAGNADKVYKQECQLSNYGQQLATARARATTADLAEIELGLLKAQLITVMRLLRMRRELCAAHPRTPAVSPFDIPIELIELIELLGAAGSC